MTSEFRLVLLGAAFLLSGFSLIATVPSRYANKPEAWLRSEEGRRIAANVVSWQTPSGDWPKNRDTASKPLTSDDGKVRGTFDNGATTSELRFLVRAFGATQDTQNNRAIQKGIDLILEAQYPTGGWPQYFPPGNGYHQYITFNDNSMVRILELLRDVADSPDYAFLPGEMRDAARRAFAKGIDCIVACQIVVNGKRTVWCAQHDQVDLRPRPARAYELESLSGGESAAVLKLLMSLDHPSDEVRRAIHAGAAWFESAKLTGIRVEKEEGIGRVVIADPEAPPVWARFYEIETNRPFFCGRDGVKKYRLSDIEAERRNGYAWYGSWGRDIAKAYEDWLKK